MNRSRFHLLPLAFLACTAVPSLAWPASLTPPEVADWRADLQTLSSELVRIHPLLFAGLTPTHLTRAGLDSAVADLDARIPSLARHEVIVGMEQIVARVGAGHTSINPFFDPATGFRSYPLELEWFRDGLYVVRADPAWRALLGARVVRVGDLAIEDAMARVTTVVSHENDFFVRAQGPAYLMIPEVAGALGIVRDMESLPLTVEQDGRRRTLAIAPAGPLPPRRHDGGVPPERAGWVDLRPGTVPAPLWLSHPESRRWFEYLPESGTLYVAYQSSVPPHGAGEPIDAFFDRVLAAVDSLSPARLVIDVRDNLGGDGFYNRKFLLGILRRPQVDHPGRLFMIIGRGTYSAAQNLVNDFERWTNVTFVGEPTGSPPSFFGDHRPVRLPRSGIQLNVSTLWWQAHDPRDRRPFVPPAVYAEPTAADHRAGVDPVFEAVLTRANSPALEAVLEEALAAGDTALAARHLREGRADPANRYSDVETRVNAHGYALLRAGELERAAQVLALNARVFPGSANAQDSAGEAYERLGRRDAAIDAYRRALALVPNLPSSRDALHRLGAAP